MSGAMSGAFGRDGHLARLRCGTAATATTAAAARAARAVAVRAVCIGRWPVW